MRTLKEDYTGIEADGAALRLALSYAHLYRTEREQNLSGARVRRSSFLALAALLIIGPPLLWVLDVTLFDSIFSSLVNSLVCGLGILGVMGLGGWAFLHSRKVQPDKLAPPQPMEIAKVYWPFWALKNPADDGTYVLVQPDRVPTHSALVNAHTLQEPLQAQPAQDEVALLNQIGDMAELLVLLHEQQMPGFVPHADVLGRTLARLAASGVAVEGADPEGLILGAGEGDLAQARAFLSELHETVDVIARAGADTTRLPQFQESFHAAVNAQSEAVEAARQALDQWVTGNLAAPSSRSADHIVYELDALFAPSISQATEAALAQLGGLSDLSDQKSKWGEAQATRERAVRSSLSTQQRILEEKAATERTWINKLNTDKNEIIQSIGTISAQLSTLSSEQEHLVQGLAEVDHELAAADETPAVKSSSATLGPKLAQPAALARRVGLQKRRQEIESAQKQGQLQAQELQQQLADRQRELTELEQELKKQVGVLAATEENLKAAEQEAEQRLAALKQESAQQIAALENEREQEKAKIWEKARTLAHEKDALISLRSRASAHLDSWSEAIDKAAKPIFAQRHQALENAHQVIDQIVVHLRRYATQGSSLFAAYRWAEDEITAGELYLVPFWLYRLPNAPWTLLGVPGECTVVPRQDPDDLGYVLKDDPVLKVFLAQQLDRRTQAGIVDAYTPVSRTVLRAHIDSLAARGYITSNLHTYILRGLGVQ